MKLISIIVENESQEDIDVNLFDSRDWNKQRCLNISTPFPETLNYDDILHNLIKNNMCVGSIYIEAYKGDCFNGGYDYLTNPLNTTIECIEGNIFGVQMRTQMDIKEQENSQQNNMIAREDCNFNIGNLAYIKYTSKAKTTVKMFLIEKEIVPQQ